MRRRKPKITQRKNRKTPIEEDNKKYSLKELKEIISQRHRDVANEYICNGWNKTEAYLKVYPGVSRATAGVEGHRVLTNPKVQQYIEYMRTDCEELCGITKQKQVNEWKLLAYSDIAAFHDSWISRKDWDEIKARDPNVTKAVKKIEYQTIQKLNEFKEPVEVEYVKLELHSKTTALAAIDGLMGYKATETVNVVIEQPLFPTTK